MTTPLTATDRLDLLDLVHRYAATVDARDWDAVGALFVPDGRLTVPDPPRSTAPTTVAVGRPAVRALLEPLEAFARTVHHVTGSTWTADGADGARGRTTGVAHHVEAGEQPVDWIWHLEYADRAVRTADGWLLAERDLHLRLVERGSPVLVDRPPPGRQDP